MTDPAQAASSRARRRPDPALAIIVGVAGLYLLHAAAAVFVPLLVSILLAYALEPPVAMLQRGRLPRLAAVVIVYIGLAALAALTGRAAARQVASFAQDLPSLTHQLADAVAPLGRGPAAVLTRLPRDAAGIARTTMPREPPAANRTAAAAAPPFAARAYVLRATAGAMSIAVDLIVVALLTFLLLATGDLYKRKLVKLGGETLAQRKVTLETIQSIDRQIEIYLVVRIAISAIVAAATALGLIAVGERHAVVWGLVAGVLNVLPFAGPAIAIALITLAAFLQFHAPGPTMAAGAVAFGVAVLEGNALTPWLTSRAAALNAVAVFAGVLFFGWLWDVWGLVVAVPIMVALKAAGDHINGLRPIGQLLGE